MDPINRYKNYQREPLQYNIAFANNGNLIAGGAIVGNTGNSSDNGSYIIIKTGAGIVAMPTNNVRTANITPEAEENTL